MSAHLSSAAAGALLPLPVVLPLIGAVLAPLIGKLSRALPFAVAIAMLAGSTGVLVLLAAKVYGHNSTIVAHFFGHWGPVHGQVLGVAFAADPLGLTFALLAAGIGAVLLLAAYSELGRLGPRETAGFACLFQLLIAALIGLALTADTIDLFVWFQVASLASYGLCGFFLERPIALEATFKLVILTSMAGFVVFIGAAVLYDVRGGLNFGQLNQSLAQHLGTADLASLALLITGLGTKAGIVPMHGWLPDAHTPAPGTVSALFSGLMVNLGVVGIVRIALQLYPGRATGHHLIGLLLSLGCASALLGAVLALTQDDLKRLLAWDTVSQMGILLIGFATASTVSVAGAVYHLISHALFKSLLFLCAGAVVHTTGETALSRLGGLARQRRSLAVGFTVGTAAIAGVPPLSGYASIGLIHEGVHAAGEPIVYTVLLVAQTITIAALARAAWMTFFRTRAEDYDSLERPRTDMRVALLILGGGSLAAGVLPGRIITDIAAPAASAITRPAAYAHAILSSGGALPAVTVRYHYWEPTELVLTALTIVVGLALCVLVVRRPNLGWLRLPSRLHTGSANDYAAYATAGIAAALLVLLM